MICSAVESLDAVLDGIAGGEHKDRSRDVVLAQRPADRDSIFARQHDVEDNRVIGCALGILFTLHPIIGRICGIALLDQALFQGLVQMVVVLDDKYAHECCFLSDCSIMHQKDDRNMKRPFISVSSFSCIVFSGQAMDSKCLRRIVLCTHCTCKREQTKGESYGYHCIDQYREAYPDDRAPASADSRHGLGAASLSRQPPLLAAGPLLLLSLVLRDLDPADPTHFQSRACQSAVLRLPCRNQRLGTAYDPSIRNVAAAGDAPALCQCGWRESRSRPTHPRPAPADRPADLGLCLGTLPGRPADEPGAGAAFAGRYPGDGPVPASHHHRLSVAADRQCDGHLD